MKPQRVIFAITKNEEFIAQISAALDETCALVTAPDVESCRMRAKADTYAEACAFVLLIDEDVARGFEPAQIAEAFEASFERPVILVIVASQDVDESFLERFEDAVADIVLLPERPLSLKRHLDGLMELSEIRALHEKVAKDPVSGVYARRFFDECAGRARRSEPDKRFDLLCLELESFDLLHGRYGSQVCDEFIKSMVQGLTQFFLKDAIAGRMDDAHLVFLMPHTAFSVHKSMMEACLDISSLSPYPFFDIKGAICEIRLGMDIEDAYRCCLVALEGIRYDASSFIAEYDERLQSRQERERIIEGSMREALSEKQFEVYYQPKYRMDGVEIVGAEALVRWNHPQLGFLSPGSFIPLFEKNGFIFELDKYVLDQVGTALAAWEREGLATVPVSVNVSQTDFDRPALAQELEAIVDSHGVAHDHIHFEITESSEAPDALKKIVVAKDLRERAFKLELDDLGAGYSTLGVLRDMPVDVVKTDASLVRNLGLGVNRAILEGSLFTAHRTGAEILVEGVETPSQFADLQAICAGRVEPHIQGFLYSKPLPESEFRKLLAQEA